MYQHGKRVRRPRSATVFLATIAIVGVVILVAWFIVHRDIANTTGPKSNVPIVTDLQASDGAGKITIDEPLFSIELPKDWKLLERRNDEDSNFYIWAATAKGADDRRLTLYIDTMPKVYKVVKMLTLIPNGATFLVGNVSDNCVEFAGGAATDPQARGNAPFEAKWDNIIFQCDPIVNNQTIGTGVASSGIAAPLIGSKGIHTFFFYYEDHNVYPNNSILTEAVESFTAK